MECRCLLKRWWCCLRHRWVECFERVWLADCLDLAVGWVFSVANDHCCRHLWCCFHLHWCHLDCCCYLPNFDSSCLAMTTNWMPISVKMVRPVLVYRPVNRVLACPDTNDMVEVFVVQRRRPLGDSTNRLPMVVHPVDLVHQPLQQRPHTAKHRCTADLHTIFGMQHSYLWLRKWLKCSVF